ncbi:hypothetical protein [Curtobacterium sp. 20TX0008]|uniref:hypothetical protein n=1 Tax=Curtobacterium sp. 20TX0008 TaxID=3022018 RepID=UPI00232C105E|nr:hypothetical protein [Curtobacterium sp. 20TX0008]MDB6427449.1 hypothetical protein [Curtobacterium sp. 20TX0008]
MTILSVLLSAGVLAALTPLVALGVFTYWGHVAVKNAGTQAERASLAREFALRVLDVGRWKWRKKDDGAAPPGGDDRQDG